MGYTNPEAELSPERKISIHTKVNGGVVRVALGSVLILTFIPLFLVLLIIKFFLGPVAQGTSTGGAQDA